MNPRGQFWMGFLECQYLENNLELERALWVFLFNIVKSCYGWIFRFQNPEKLPKKCPERFVHPVRTTQ